MMSTFFYLLDNKKSVNGVDWTDGGAFMQHDGQVLC